MTLFDENALQSISSNLKGSIIKSSGIMSTEESAEVISICKQVGSFEEELDAMVAIAGLCQLGATNRNAGKSLKYTYKSRSLTVGDLWQACQQAKRNGTPRQFARANASFIAKIALKLSETGDLARQMLLDVPNMTIENEIRCSNFQSANPDCPDQVRTWLRFNFQKHFEN